MWERIPGNYSTAVTLGDSWEILADFLPPIQSVEAAVVEE